MDILQVAQYFSELQKGEEKHAQQAKCPHILYAKQSNKGFIIFYFNGSKFFKHILFMNTFIGESYQSYKVHTNEENNTNKTIHMPLEVLSVLVERPIVFILSNHFVVLSFPSVFALCYSVRRFYSVIFVHSLDQNTVKWLNSQGAFHSKSLQKQLSYSLSPGRI